MNRNIILIRPVEVQGWNVIGQIAKPRKRQELGPVLMRAQETDGTDAQDVAEHLCFGTSRQGVAQRLLRICVSLDLLKKEAYDKYVLTNRGDEAIQVGEVFVPERGAWTLWTSDDPLLPSPILRVDDFKGVDAHIEVRASQNPKPSFENLPDHLRNAKNKKITPPASSDGITIRIDELEDKVERIKEAELELSLHWNLGERHLRLKGTWEGTEIDAELQAPDTSFEEIWDVLLANEGLSEAWVFELQALRVSFDETSCTQREIMSRELKFQNPSLFEYGDFQSFEVPQVNITPRSQDDAREWATWRLNSRIRDFATTKLYEEWWKEASEPFSEFHLECPARSELATIAWESAGERPDTRTWYLVAAEDWNLK